MRTQIHNEHWKWIIWLFILTLLNAIALAEGRGGHRGDRSSSDSAKQPQQAQQSPQPAPQQAPAREARPVSQPVAQPASQPRRTEAPVSVSQSDSPRREVRSRPQSDSTNQAVSSQSQPRTVQSSRPVRHEVIVAPSSQSMDVSSPRTVTQSVSSGTTQRTVQSVRNRTVEVGQVQSGQSGNSASTAVRPVRREVIVAPSSQSLDVSSPKTVTQSVSSGTTDRTVRSGRDRTVEVSKVQSEQSSNSVSTTVTQPRRDRTAQTVQIASNDSKTTPQQSTLADSNKQSRDRVERTNKPQTITSQSNATTSSSITTTDTAKSQKAVTSVTSGAKPDRTQVSNRSDNSRNSRASTVVRHEGKRSQDSKVEPAVTKTDQTDTRTQRSLPLLSDGQRADNRDRTMKPQDASRAPSIIASRTDSTERTRGDIDSGSSGRESDSRWSKLRSKITDRADSDIRSRDGRSDREGRLGRDENRGRVVVNNNNIHIERGDRDDHSRPFVSRHLIHDIRPIRDDHRWEHHGSYFSFHWSNRSCGRVIMAPYHNYYGISYYYPAYHRQYLFVSLGGYWPYSYRYQRYYWYGCHPYYWYGSYVVPQPETVVYDYTTTNNYYSTPDYYYSTPTVNTVTQVEATTVLPEDSSATDAPLPQTQADICFAEAVNAFEQGRYDNSVELFRQAVLMSPDDEILPFTYTQSLFASGDYALAAYVLREVMAKMPVQEPAVYFPRGLYKDDQILINQIASLESAIAIEPFSTDYQLLLGYQCMGIGQWDKAVNALEQAARNPLNAGVVNKLLDIAEKMENDAGQAIITAPQI